MSKLLFGPTAFENNESLGELIQALLDHCPLYVSADGIAPSLREVVLYHRNRAIQTRLPNDVLTNLIVKGALSLAVSPTNASFLVLDKEGVEMIPESLQGQPTRGGVSWGHHVRKFLGEATGMFTDKVKKTFSGFDIIKSEFSHLVWSRIPYGSWDKLGGLDFVSGVGKGDEQTVRLKNTYRGSRPQQNVFEIETEQRREVYLRGQLVSVNGIPVPTEPGPVPPDQDDADAPITKSDLDRALGRTVEEIRVLTEAQFKEVVDELKRWLAPEKD